MDLMIMQRCSKLPIHFFTIVLNGQPFIKYHINILETLPFEWHWHIVEGVAELTGDTAWSLASGGKIDPSTHASGLSIDGTTEYIDQLQARFPDRVTVYRKPSGQFWNGKVEMVRAPLPNISQECLLWQIDIDELWTEEQICKVRSLFLEHPQKTAAWYWSWFFVGQNLLVSSRYCYSQNPRQEWLRTWRFKPGMQWAAHEPPTLVEYDGSTWKDVGRDNPFGHDFTESQGLVFQHYAYTLAAQLEFKESYYGYKDALKQWQLLQRQTSFPVKLKDFFAWVNDETTINTANSIGVIPLLSLDNSENHKDINSFKNISIVIDAVFFQLYKTGIARLWTSLIIAWSQTRFAQNIVVLDRVHTSPRIDGIRYIDLPAFSYDNIETDRAILQEICDRENASFFISTYYTFPQSTASVFMAYDMIPELLGFDLNLPMWREKINAIHHASAFISISDSTYADLNRLYPSTTNKPAITAYCGISPDFFPSSTNEVNAFKASLGMAKPYFLLCGSRIGYKNAKLFFKAFSQLSNYRDFEIVCTGNATQLEPEFASLIEGCKVHLSYLSDAGLRAAFSGAIALVFPSLYEGFGLPVLEAMACGCPVITTPSSSLPEVGGNAAIYVKGDDVAGMVQALQQVCKPEVRQGMIQRGLERAKHFSWDNMAAKMETFLTDLAVRFHQDKAILDVSMQSTPNTTTILETSQLRPFADQVQECLSQLQQEPQASQVLADLQQMRSQLAKYLLTHSLDRLQAEWSGYLSRAFRAVWQCGLKNELPQPNELYFVQQIANQAAGFPNDPKTLQGLLAAILYLYPHQLPLDFTRIAIPNWLVPTYMEFMFESPRLFKQIGEVDRYQEYFANWTKFIHDRVTSNPSGSVERYLCQTYANAANLTPTYFSQRSAVTVQSQRAKIIEQHLCQQTVQLDYEFPARPANRKKIRFGILSLNFNPSAETFTVLPIFEHLDRAKFEIYLFVFQSNNSETERYCRDKADRFTHLLHNHADRLVRMIRAADLDVLLVGSNITARSYPITFVSTHRLARVQVSGISSSVTTGMRHMDYYIGATLTTPPDIAQRYYTEQLVTLEGSGLCFSFPPVSAEATVAFDRTKLGLSDNATVFMSGANFRKINPELRDTWAKLLARVPDSILVIYPFGPNWGIHPNLELPFFQQMQIALQRHGVDLKRLLLIKTMPDVADVRACLAQADVYLDSFPYSGAASAIDPLTVGVPFVSLEGREQRERQSSSLLRELNLPELVTSSEAEYLDLAAKLAGDRAYREQIRQRLVVQMSSQPPFLDRQGYARKIEQLLERLVAAWSAGGAASAPKRVQGAAIDADASVQVL